MAMETSLESIDFFTAYQAHLDNPDAGILQNILQPIVDEIDNFDKKSLRINGGLQNEYNKHSSIMLYYSQMSIDVETYKGIIEDFKKKRQGEIFSTLSTKTNRTHSDTTKREFVNIDEQHWQIRCDYRIVEEINNRLDWIVDLLRSKSFALSNLMKMQAAGIELDS
jgi:hypothetical protein